MISRIQGYKICMYFHLLSNIHTLKALFYINYKAYLYHQDNIHSHILYITLKLYNANIQEWLWRILSTQCFQLLMWSLNNIEWGTLYKLLKSYNIDILQSIVSSNHMLNVWSQLFLNRIHSHIIGICCLLGIMNIRWL